MGLTRVYHENNVVYNLILCKYKALPLSNMTNLHDGIVDHVPLTSRHVATALPDKV
jgi:hypothetical protein